ncbi:MAG: DNA recombination protein RmuC, partial [Micavibrio sp.]|nr:DNA recombination protein RmuC [Micavibrio sp.]
MDIIIVGLIVTVLLVNIALFLKFKSKPDVEDNKDQEVLKIKDDINSLKNSLGDSFNSMSKEVAKDMTVALTKVDEKVGNFNQQVQLLNQSQEGITKILAGVKKYGT